MILAYVKGTVVSTNKTSQLKGRKLLVVEEWNPLTGECSRHPKVAVDTVNAGEGGLVFCVSGSSARQTEETEKNRWIWPLSGLLTRWIWKERYCTQNTKKNKGG